MSKTRIAITYNEKIGGSSVISLKNSIKELDSEVVDADYRLITSDLPDLEDIYTNRKKRSTLFKKAKMKAILFLKDIDGLILSGNSAMVDPRLYSENLDKQKIDLARNIAEVALIHVAIQKGIPLLGICGGHQIINVYFGGSLKALSSESISKQKFMDYSAIQIDAQSELGQLLLQGGSIPQNKESIMIENFFGAHNQTIKGLGGKGLINDGIDDYLKCSAIAADDDGNVEAVESKYGSLLMGLQFHPEVGVKGLPKKEFIFQAPTESEILKNKRILETFNQAAETHHRKKMVVQEVSRVFNGGNLTKKRITLVKKNKTKNFLKNKKSVLSRMVVFFLKKIGKLIRKILSYKLTNKKSKLFRKKQLKRSYTLPPTEKIKEKVFALNKDFLNIATKESSTKNKFGKKRKSKKFKMPSLKINQSKKHNYKSKKRSYNNNSFFKKNRKAHSAIKANRLSTDEKFKKCFTRR